MQSFRIENEADVDERRAEIGLPTMAEYVAVFSDICGEAALPVARPGKLTGHTKVSLVCSLWVGSGSSRPSVSFPVGNMICWLDRLQSAKSSHTTVTRYRYRSERISSEFHKCTF